MSGPPPVFMALTCTPAEAHWSVITRPAGRAAPPGAYPKVQRSQNSASQASASLCAVIIASPSAKTPMKRTSTPVSPAG